MATYVDIVKFESEAPADTIRLVRSGEFYRAYNHSAWLFQTCITKHKVMRKYVKALKSDIYYIGFPEICADMKDYGMVSENVFSLREMFTPCNLMNITVLQINYKNMAGNGVKRRRTLRPYIPIFALLDISRKENTFSETIP